MGSVSTFSQLNISFNKKAEIKMVIITNNYYLGVSHAWEHLNQLLNWWDILILPLLI